MCPVWFERLVSEEYCDMNFVLVQDKCTSTYQFTLIDIKMKVNKHAKHNNKQTELTYEY